jgi:hypothetical protein
MLVSGSGKWTHAQRGEAEFIVKAIGDDANECNHLESLLAHDLFTVAASFGSGELRIVVTAVQPPITTSHHTTPAETLEHLETTKSTKKK